MSNVPAHVSKTASMLSEAVGGGEVAEAVAEMMAVIDAAPSDEAEEKVRMEYISGEVPVVLGGHARAGKESADFDLIAAAALGIAELAKGKRFREILGGQAAEAVVEALDAVLATAEASESRVDSEEKVAKALVQCLRSVGNMAFYCDKNREALHAAGLGPVAVRLLTWILDDSASPGLDSRLGMVTMGGVGNYIASDSNTFVDEILAAGTLLHDFVFAGLTPARSYGLVTMSLRAFQSTWFDATWKTIFGEYHVVDVLCALLAGSEADASLVLESLATVTDQAEVAVAVAAAELPAPRAGEKLLDVVMKAASCVDEDEEDEAAAATLILSHLALVNELANELVDRGAVARFCALASVAPSAGGAAMATRKPLMLLMGNLARSEEQCVALMKAGFCEAAVFNLRLVAGDDDELPLQHAILGSLRNLAIARPVRAVLRTSGVLDELLPILASPHQPMQFNAAAIARHLVKRPAAAELETPEGAEDASGAAEAALYLATVPGFVARLAELAAVEAVNVKMESARALAALAATPESSMATGAALPSLAPFTVLLESEHAVLHTEAVAALGSLAAVSPPPEAFSSSDARDGCVAALDALGESALDAVAVAASIRGTA